MEGASKQKQVAGGGQHSKGPLYPSADPGTVLAVQGTLAQVKASFDANGKDLQSQDKLGNFEIQGLMSDYNEAQTLASSVQKKLHDSNSAVIGKI